MFREEEAKFEVSVRGLLEAIGRDTEFMKLFGLIAHSVNYSKVGGLKIIVFAGLPLTGKSTLAKLLEDRLRITRLDLDEIRKILFKYSRVNSETNRELGQAQIRSSWESLYALAANVLLAGESVIVAGTFSREIQHQKAKTIAETYGAIQKVVFCYSSDQVISERIKLRRLDEENPSNLRSMDGYNRVKERYVKISAPELLEIDTAESSESCLKKIIKFVLE